MGCGFEAVTTDSTGVATGDHWRVVYSTRSMLEKHDIYVQGTRAPILALISSGKTTRQTCMSMDLD